MFEKAKFEKNKNKEDASVVKVFLGIDADKTRISGCEKLFKKCFDNYLTEKTDEVTVSTASTEALIEKYMAEIMDFFVSIKVEDTIKFTVNGNEYEI